LCGRSETKEVVYRRGESHYTWLMGTHVSLPSLACALPLVSAVPETGPTLRGLQLEVGRKLAWDVEQRDRPLIDTIRRVGSNLLCVLGFGGRGTSELEAVAARWDSSHAAAGFGESRRHGGTAMQQQCDHAWGKHGPQRRDGRALRKHLGKHLAADHGSCLGVCSIRIPSARTEPPTREAELSVAERHQLEVPRP
jgi:hypothetical protein